MQQSTIAHFLTYAMIDMIEDSLQKDKYLYSTALYVLRKSELLNITVDLIQFMDIHAMVWYCLKLVSGAEDGCVENLNI